jgi:hypothetical protein
MYLYYSGGGGAGRALGDLNVIFFYVLFFAIIVTA